MNTPAALDEKLAKFLKRFEAQWETEMAKLGVSQKQLLIGSRLRPQITFWGYCASLANGIDPDFDYISNISVSIEMIHKASLVIDDWVDRDLTRHGEPTFHEEYGPENAIANALFFVTESLSRLHQIIPSHIISPTNYYMCIGSLISALHSMSLGLLDELKLNNESIVDIERIKHIANLETSSVIYNGMLLGYYSGGGNNSRVAAIFKVIGDQCGYLFQTMNDLEAFENADILKVHKGKLNYDIDLNRKNIAIAKLFSIANSKDKQIVKNANGEDISDLFKKYKVSLMILNEMTIVYNQILKEIENLKEHGLTAIWIEEFSRFIWYLKSVAEKRLRK